jgi:hypothetical protein
VVGDSGDRDSDRSGKVVWGEIFRNPEGRFQFSHPGSANLAKSGAVLKSSRSELRMGSIVLGRLFLRQLLPIHHETDGELSAHSDRSQRLVKKNLLF